MLNSLLYLGLIILSSLAMTSCQQGKKNKNPEAPPKYNAQEFINSPTVLLISLDGFRYDYINKHSARNLQKISFDGVRAESLIPVFPTLTFPNHYSIITGRYAENHGLVSNNFYDLDADQEYSMGNKEAVADPKWYGGEPIWTVVEKVGMLSGVCFWVGSEADIQGVRPSYLQTYSDEISNRERTDKVLGWLRLPLESRPHFLTLYYSDVDSAGHKYGTTSKELKSAVQRLDEEIGYLYSTIIKEKLNVNIVIVSDHGMDDYIKPDQMIDISKITDLKNVILREKGAIAHIYAKNKEDLVSVYEDLKKNRKNFSIYYKGEVPPRFRYSKNSKIGDIVIVADPTYYITYPTGFNPLLEANEEKQVRGTHGWNPQHKNMHGIFLAVGPNIRKGMPLGSFENIHIYPFILNLLGVQPSTEFDGDVKVLKNIYFKNINLNKR